jgi:hypothetical protein
MGDTASAESERSRLRMTGDETLAVAALRGE